jgi:hypothetical protein
MYIYADICVHILYMSNYTPKFLYVTICLMHIHIFFHSYARRIRLGKIWGEKQMELFPGNITATDLFLTLKERKQIYLEYVNDERVG